MTDETIQQHIEVLNTASAKLPTFYTDDPETWFLQADAIFTADRIISQSTRFNRTFGQLPRQVVTQVADIATEPGDKPYDTLKGRLVAIYGATKSQKIQQTLDNTQLGDQRPSQLLRKMQLQMGTTTPEEILRVLWTRALPTRVQAIIAAWEKEDLKKLAEIADRVIGVAHQTNIASVNAESPNNQQEMKKQIEALTEKFNDLQCGKETRRHNERQRSRSRSNDGLCYYHKQWGTTARKCQQPCSWRRGPRTYKSKNY